MTEEGHTIAGRYRLVQRIGSGAMGVVWRAHDERLGRTIAIKQLLLEPGLSSGEAEEAKQRAMREGRIAARLQHPNAISVYDVAEEDGQPWLVMEYLPSKSLSTVLSERGPLPPHEVARIGSHVAAALAAAHSAGIVHRDIKPGNVLLGDDGTVKITDFGISRATGDVTVTATGMLAGTPAYLAPEVAKGYDPGPPSDVFSLGSTLYAAVEGEPPFGVNENTLAMLHAVAAGEINPIRQAGPLTPLLSSLLEAEPNSRPTMNQANEALGAVAAGRSIPPNLLASGTTTQPVQNWHNAAPTTQDRPGSGPMRAAAPPPPPAWSGTRLDAHPMGDLPSAQRMHAQGPSGPPPRRPAAAAGPGTRPPRGRSSRRPMMLTGLAIVAAAVAGILLANFFSDGTKKQNNAAPLPPAAQAPAPTTTTTPRPTTKKPTTTTEPTSSTPEQVTQQDMERAVREYYSLLPQHPDQAFNRISSRFQAATGGFDNYKKFWSLVEEAKTGRTAGANAQGVAMLVTIKAKDGRTSRELHVFTFTQQNGKLLIDTERATPAPGNLLGSNDSESGSSVSSGTAGSEDGG